MVSSKFFCVTGPKNFVSEIFWNGEKFMLRDGGKSFFPSKNFCLTVPCA